jgi:hypothetical protein
MPKRKRTIFMGVVVHAECLDHLTAKVRDLDGVFAIDLFVGANSMPASTLHPFFSLEKAIGECRPYLERELEMYPKAGGRPQLS